MVIANQAARWGATPRGRRNAVLALAVLAHALLIAAMLRSRASDERTNAGATVEATIWLTPPPAQRAATEPLPQPHATRLRSIAHAAVEPQAIRAPVLEARPTTQAALAPEPPASAASQPLNLTLTRDQLRGVIAGSTPTLAQSLARPAAPSALARIGGDDAAYEEKELPGGEREVRVHGGCFRLVPTARSQYDPFNHGGEHLTAACK
jgi:hypothetical protein